MILPNKRLRLEDIKKFWVRSNWSFHLHIDDKVRKLLAKVIFSGIALAMGIATLVLNILKQLEPNTAITLLSIGLICLAIMQLENK